MKFYDFSKYEYYALIGVSEREKFPMDVALEAYMEEVAEIDEEEKGILPKEVSKEQALEIYKNYQFKAVNAINASKLNIKSPDVVINVNSDASDKVTAQIIDGKKCLVVELDENVDINGLNVRIK